ncbi:helix-turn-helix domain-containing protein [Tamlana sp. 2201CG12-4]|uniref:helix-turn-helix domain-containing protein n=1 Tax=Tamlana sp. 2201CG12-4 TaxID=3112582 RepID=UPI002DB7CB54|nr:helix-turn-helix domain-containing protein [Tamlana sp. 2201CG12-4]MEC3905437.1 helix-turn-helix domain-containing protein [Tamlana sp. 2201CG12-4]
MEEKIQQIEFNNKRKNSEFDFINLKDLFSRKDISHSLYDFQRINFYMLLFFTNGHGQHTIDFTDYTYCKGTVLSIRKDQIHKFFKTDGTGYLLLFTDDFLIQFFERSEVLKSLQLFNELITSPKVQLNNNEFLEFSGLIEAIAQEYLSFKDDHSMSIIRSLLHILFRKMLRIKSKNHQVLSDKKYLREFIQFQQLVEHQCFQTKKVADYGKQLGVSTKTLNNITNHIVHKSAKNFINEIVITQIKRLLVNTNLSIKEIAFSSGFEDSSNLFKFFKKYTQQTPEGFRLSHQ